MTGSAPDSPPAPPEQPPHRQLALAAGLPDALRILRTWARRPLPVLAPWLAVSFAIALLLLALVWLVGSSVAPDPTRPRGLPGIAPRDWLDSARHVLQRNVVVLALHATACLAGFIIYFATREPPSADDDALERATRLTARVAFWFVPAATVMSIVTQAWVLGSYAATAAAHLSISVGALLRSTLVHSVPELMAVFLPLAAWLVALRRGRLEELYAATIASVVVALPVLAVAAWQESDHWDERVRSVRPDYPALTGSTYGTMVDSLLGFTPGASPEVRALEFGERIEGADRFDELESLIAAQEQSDRLGSTVAVVQLGIRFVLYELRLGPASDPCLSTSDAAAARADRREPGAARPAQLDQLRELRFLQRRTGLPGALVDLDVDSFVQGQQLVSPSSLDASPFVSSVAAARCSTPDRDR